MKNKSERYPHVFYERWKTPIRDIHYTNLELSGVLQTITETYFFLNSCYEIDIKTHVMSVPRTYPYRLMEEEFALTCIGKYFREKGPYKPFKQGRGRPTKPCSTWKLWGTSFINELDEGHALSHYQEEKDKTVCEYLVKTNSEWIEIVDCMPVWELHKNIKIEKLVEHYVKKRYRDWSPEKWVE